jgi:hypothetical protein
VKNPPKLDNMKFNKAGMLRLHPLISRSVQAYLREYQLEYEQDPDVRLNSSGDHYTALLTSIAITLIATCKMATKDYARTVSPMEVIQIVNQLQAEGVFQNTGPAARVIN